MWRLRAMRSCFPYAFYLSIIFDFFRHILYKPIFSLYNKMYYFISKDGA